MSKPERKRLHLVVGGFPPGSSAGHDMDYARLELLRLLHEQPGFTVSVSNDFADLAKWLEGSQGLVTYVAGPYPDEEQSRVLQSWLEAGGRWLALHGTSGGRAQRVGTRRLARKMVKEAHHATLGAFFLNHPPVRRFRVDVGPGSHAVTRGLPSAFEVADELYLIEILDPAGCQTLLVTELPEDPSPAGFGFVYDADTSLQADGRTRVLGYARPVGNGEIVYVALGHCHAPASNVQPFVDASVVPDGTTPLLFRGPWEDEPFVQLLRNGLAWCGGAAAAER